MYVGVMQVELRLHGPTNLKEKRRIVKSLKDRLRHHFEVAVAEVGPLEAYTESVLGIALVSNEGRHARQRCQAVLDFLERVPDAEVLDHQVEVL
jgi:hypothetical protein